MNQPYFANPHAMFYDVASQPQTYSAQTLTHKGYGGVNHPWPNLVETSGDEAKEFNLGKWAEENKMYLLGGGLVVAGLVAWQAGLFK